MLYIVLGAGAAAVHEAKCPPLGLPFQRSKHSKGARSLSAVYGLRQKSHPRLTKGEQSERLETPGTISDADCSCTPAEGSPQHTTPGVGAQLLPRAQHFRVLHVALACITCSGSLNAISR